MPPKFTAKQRKFFEKKSNLGSSLTYFDTSNIEPYQPKRPRLDTPVDTSPNVNPVSDVEPRSTSAEPDIDVLNRIYTPLRPQGSTAHLEEFRKIYWKLLKYMFAVEAPNEVGTPCSCQRADSNRLYHCNDCFDFDPCCGNCFIERHRSNPFHWAEFWNGSFLERRDISELGFVHHMRHGTGCKSCPDSAPVNFTVVDVTGIHATKVAFCQCLNQDNSRLDLLLRCQIFPSTVSQPKLGFTFNVLRDFHLQTLTSKKSSYDYITALKRRTNNAFPDKVESPYSQFLRAQRLWRAITLIKRSGQAHDIDKQLPGRRAGNLVVPCFACPEPAFNVPDEQWMTTSEDLKFLNTLVLMMDGHFGLQRLSKVDDPEDVSLVDGTGLFPPDDRYNTFVRNKVAYSEEKSTCSKFSAVEMQNKLKFKGACITGVVGVACNRHMVFHSLVDLQKGERYANADFALAFALERYSMPNGLRLPDIDSTYDVNCQFYKKIKERWSTSFPHLMGYLDNMRFMVPKKHLDGHKEDCKYKFSMNYTKGTGRAHGKGIEVSWSESKQAGGSTRQMNHGHRQDTLNDYHIDWNWTLVSEMAKTLAEKIKKAKVLRTKHTDFFLSVSIINGQERVEEWEKLSTEPYRKNGEWQSVYRYRQGKLPSQAQMLQSLERIDKEMDEEPATPKVKGSKQTLSRIISSGMKLQDKQQDILHYWEPQGIETRTQRRASLAKEIRNWRKLQIAAFPQLEDIIVNANLSNDIEKETLFLPSDFNSEKRKELDLDAAAETEFNLRQGQANDTIKTLCNTIMHGMVLQNEKKERSRGVEKNLKSLKHINTVKDKKKKISGRYRFVRTRILSLKPDNAEIAEDFPELTEADTYAKNAASSRKLGDGKSVDSWIWCFGRLKGLSEAEKADFIVESERVQWFRARADMERWVEEVDLLEEEMRRLKRSCEKMAEIWTNLSCSKAINPRYVDPKTPANIAIIPSAGYRAYAAQKASMYRTMAANAHTWFTDVALGGYPSENETLSEYVTRKRPRMTVDWEKEAEERLKAEAEAAKVEALQQAKRKTG